MKAGTLFLALLVSSQAHAHGGGLNAEGCHNNRKTGDYHCHRAPSTERVPQDNSRVPSPPSAPDTRTSGASAQRLFNSGVPTCHVGPRGGTYTITPSGRKNYSGC